MSDTTELSLQTDAQLSPTSAPIGKMLETVINRGVTAENVGALEKLVDLYERMQAKDAERQFNQAFIEVKRQIPKIFADRTVPDKFGNVKFKFAAYEDIMAVLEPIMMEHGFTVTFSMEIKDDRVTQTCVLSHIGGHSRTNQFMARIGSGPPGASPAQADGAAATYSKRFALCNAWNIVIERDSDGMDQDSRNEGAPISFEQAQYLRELVKETKSDEAKFLAVAQAKTYDEIGSEKYDMLASMLHRKKNAR